MLSTSAHTTLRERKKQRTRQDVKRVALELASKHGLRHLTVDAISAAADISPRTFFNFFSSKQEALVDGDEEAIGRITEAIRQRPLEESPIRALRNAILDAGTMQEIDGRQQMAITRMRLVRDNPSLLPHQIGAYASFERTLCLALAQRLGADADNDARPQLLAALGVGAIRIALRIWAGSPDRELPEVVVEAFDLLEHDL